MAGVEAEELIADIHSARFYRMLLIRIWVRPDEFSETLWQWLATANTKRLNTGVNGCSGSTPAYYC